MSAADLPTWTIVAAVFWIGGSIAFAALMPWSFLDREDRWLAWALIGAWPIVLGWMAVELLIERRKAGR